MGLLSNESVSMPASGFADGVEVEETFPDVVAEPAAEVAAAPIVPTKPHLTVVRPEPASNTQRDPEPAHAAAPAAVREVTNDDPLERRLREAEALVRDTVERMRAEEERRLAEWVRERREEEERRLASWTQERRAAVERSFEQRSSHEDDLARRIEDMLVEWQARFEQRLEQRHVDDERQDERRRKNDEQRLLAWRSELERALQARFTERHDRAPLPVSSEPRSPLRDALRVAGSARDVGRVLRDALAEMTQTAALALSIHHAQRPEVAYRYRVAAEDELGTLLRRETLDDGPDSAAAHMDGWSRAHRTLRLGTRNFTVHTAQCAVRVNDATLGVLTLQSEGSAIADPVLASVSDLVILAAPRLAELRETGQYRGA